MEIFSIALLVDLSISRVRGYITPSMAVRSVQRKMSSVWSSPRCIMEPNQEKLGNSSNRARAQRGDDD
jgi:hypothetical protein